MERVVIPVFTWIEVQLQRYGLVLAGSSHGETRQSHRSVMAINIKLHVAELVRGMEERAAAQAKTIPNHRAISIRGLNLGA